MMPFFGFVSGPGPDIRGDTRLSPEEEARLSQRPAAPQKTTAPPDSAAAQQNTAAQELIQTAAQIQAGGSRSSGTQSPGGSNPGDRKMAEIRQRFGGKGMGGNSGPRGALGGANFGGEFFSSLKHLSELRVTLMGGNRPEA